MKTKHVVALAACALGACALSAGEDLARHVDPFIGTKGTTHCYPNATTPFGLVQPGPASGTGEWAYTGGYQFEDPKLYGFNQTAISGTGCSDLGDLLVQPFTGPAVRADHYQFAKSSEKASPGYYAVTYPETGVMTEIAAAPHVAFYRFTFAKGGPAHVLLDLQWGIVGRGRLATHVLASEIDFPDDRTVTGHNETSHWVRRDWYYTIAFDHAVKARTKLAPRDPREKGTRWVLDFDVQPGETILMKVALSSQSVAGAQANLAAEVPGWDFDAVHARARAQWNALFARAQAVGTDEQKKTFYTSFYHLCISPNNISDVGAPRDFGTLSLWDTFRALALGHLPRRPPALYDPLPRTRAGVRHLDDDRLPQERLPLDLDSLGQGQPVHDRHALRACARGRLPQGLPRRLGGRLRRHPRHAPQPPPEPPQGELGPPRPVRLLSLRQDQGRKRLAHARVRL